MKPTRVLLAVIIVAVGLLSACSQEPRYTAQTLPSGRIVKVAGVGKMQFSADDPALMLRYYSEVDFAKPAELKAEVDEIWQQFQKDADRAGLKSAIISANEMPKGIISSTQGHNFVFRKQADGSWSSEK